MTTRRIEMGLAVITLFTVVVTSGVPDHVRGYVSRFLIEVDAGVFVGKVSSRVADNLWDRLVSAKCNGRLIQIISRSDVEQGFEIRVDGKGRRDIVDYDGLALISEFLGE